MSIIETFATDSVAPPQRLDFWNQVSSQTFSGMTVDSSSEEFSANMSRWHLGDLLMIRPISQRARVQRWMDGTSDRPDRIIFNLQHRGHSKNGQWQREAELGAGDLMLCYAADAYYTDLSDRNEMLVVEMSRAALSSRIPNIEDHLCRTIAGAAPGTRLVHDFLISLWQQGDQSDADPDWQEGIANVFLDLLAFAVKGAGSALVAPKGTRDRILALIDARLGDPDLKTGMIATELGVSLRTVQNLFAAMGTTPSAYILDRRLQKASEKLSLNRTQSITEVAYATGFNDSAYFTRCFRQRFGTTPSLWKEQK
jgi:AraC-like DNA-binding protein